MNNFLIKWMMNIAALFIVVYVAGGVSTDGWQSLVVAAFILGLFNAFLRPALILLTLPFNILSLGLFTLIINGFLFYLTSKFVKGFYVMDFWSAFWAALLFSVISFLLNIFLGPDINIKIRSGKYSIKPGSGTEDNNFIDVEGKPEE